MHTSTVELRRWVCWVLTVHMDEVVVVVAGAVEPGVEELHVVLDH